jgi:GDPmannose 4,6-dehydratase
MKRAIVIGANGQDGFFLSELLESKKYEVIKIDHDFYVMGEIPSIPIDIADPEQIQELVHTIQPNELYYLAARHQSAQDKYSEDLELYRESIEINEISLFHCLSAISAFSPKTKLFYAASSLVFGDPPYEIQDEETPINPSSIYGITKASGMFLCRKFRKEHGIFTTCGILYNHESLRRGDNFLSRKIVNGVIRATKDPSTVLEIGNLESVVDWGYAPDYVDAMYRMINLDAPDDFVVATGKKHTVLDFVSTAFNAVGLDWKKFVNENRSIVQRKTQPLIGNPSKLINLTGWSPSVTFEEMITLLVEQG